jgi:hypothetical protein
LFLAEKPIGIDFLSQYRPFLRQWADVWPSCHVLTQQSWIRALDNKFKICSKKLTNFRICYKALMTNMVAIGIYLGYDNYYQTINCQEEQ